MHYLHHGISFINFKSLHHHLMIESGLNPLDEKSTPPVVARRTKEKGGTVVALPATLRRERNDA